MKNVVSSLSTISSLSNPISNEHAENVTVVVCECLWTDNSSQDYLQDTVGDNLPPGLSSKGINLCPQ